MTDETRRRSLLHMAFEWLLLSTMSALVACSGSGGDGGSIQRLETDNRGDAFAMSVGTDAIGNAMAVWNQDKGDKADVYARMKPLGRGWGRTVQVSARGPYAHDPSVNMLWTQYGDADVNGSGHAVAVWAQYAQFANGSSRSKLMASVYTPGVGWDAPTMSPMPQGVSEYQSAVALNDHGEAMVVFRAGYPNYQANACTFSIDAGWGDCHELQTDSDEGSTRVFATINESGKAIVWWHGYRLGERRFQLAEYTPESGWGPSRIVFPEDDLGAGSIALADDGMAVITFREQRTGSIDFLGVSQFENGTFHTTTWLTPAGLERPASTAAITFGAPGKACALWREPNGGRLDFYTSCLNPSGLFAAAERIDIADETYGDSHSGFIAMNAAGEAGAIWIKDTADGVKTLWSTRYVPDVGWEEPVQLDDGKRENLFARGLALDELGNAVAIWGEQVENLRHDIWVSVF